MAAADDVPRVQGLLRHRCTRIAGYGRLFLGFWLSASCLPVVYEWIHFGRSIQKSGAVAAGWFIFALTLRSMVVPDRGFSGFNAPTNIFATFRAFIGERAIAGYQWLPGGLFPKPTRYPDIPGR